MLSALAYIPGSTAVTDTEDSPSLASVTRNQQRRAGVRAERAPESSACRREGRNRGGPRGTGASECEQKLGNSARGTWVEQGVGS